MQMNDYVVSYDEDIINKGSSEEVTEPTTETDPQNEAGQ